MESTTGYMFHELYMWHSAGELQSVSTGLEPCQHHENPETKRRLNNLIHVSGLIEHVTLIKARLATAEELCRCGHHTRCL